MLMKQFNGLIFTKEICILYILMVLLSLNIIEKTNNYIRIILFPVNRPLFPVNGRFYPVNEMTNIGNSLRIKEWIGHLTCGFGIVFGSEKKRKVK